MLKHKPANTKIRFRNTFKTEREISTDCIHAVYEDIYVHVFFLSQCESDF